VRDPKEEDLRRGDEVARRAAQTIFHRPVVLEAGAGTGKTTALTARVLSWCVGKGWDQEMGSRPELEAEPDRIAGAVLEGVVAITFTEAAAAEMASRIAEGLSRIESGGCPIGLLPEVLPQSSDERRIRARALLGNLDRLTVRTLHGFCLRLLSEAPLESGLHPYFVVDGEGSRAEEIMQHVLERALKQAYGEPGDPHLLALVAEGWGPEELLEALGSLVHSPYSPEILDEDPFAPERLHGLLDHQRGMIEALLGTIENLNGDGWGKSTTTPRMLEALAETQRLLRAVEGAAQEDVIRMLEALGAVWEDSALKRLRDWASGNFNRTELRALGDGAEEVRRRVQPVLRGIQHLLRLRPGLFQHARKALGGLWREVKEEMRARGLVGFGDLLRIARDLLRRNPGVRNRIRRGIRQLLVDEFQDTDRIQCEILQFLALEGPPEDRPGLFLVGDPKQSIYGWRDADLEAYDAFIERVLAEGGELYRLSVNFRSVPVILQETERVVSQVMKKRRGLQPSFQSLIPCARRSLDPGFRKGQWRPVEYWVDWIRDEDTGEVRPPPTHEEAVEAEAEALAHDLLRLHQEEGVPWREMGVLLRSTGDVDVYLAAMRRAGVPYAVSKDRSYFRRREVIEASALIRCILDPNDLLALLTVLRSSWVGVPDAALLPLWRRGLPDLVSQLREDAPDRLRELTALVEEASEGLPNEVPGLERIKGWEKSLLWALRCLGKLRQSLEQDPPDLFLERLRLWTLMEASEAVRHLGSFRTANLERLFRIVNAALGEGQGDSEGILRALRMGVARGLEAEEGRPKEAVEDAVQVMTIHKAKGLDFQHVYLMQLHRGTGGREGRETRVEEMKGRVEYLLLGMPTPGYWEVEERKKEVEAAERVRTLYVAMTRAKDRLVMAGRWPKTLEGRDLETARTYMDLLAHREGGIPDLISASRETTLAGHVGVEMEEGILWCFPSLGEKTKEGLLPTLEGGFGLDPKRLDRDAALLAKRRREAEIRMKKQLGGPASAEAHEALRERFLEEFQTAWMGSARRREGSRVSLAVGAAVHQALELLNLKGDPQKEIRRQLGRLPDYLFGLVQQKDEETEALHRARSLLERMAQGNLLRRLFSLAEAVVARELPVLLAPRGENAPLGFLTGSVDLLYRDPHDGGWVVADFKTDEVASEEELASRISAYALQGRVYVRAIQEALALEHPPRFELWFLVLDRIVPVDPEAVPMT